jgi:type VI secretion system ImpM family protein
MMNASSSFRGFGKLPSEADFVYLGARSEAFARFDDWLTDSMEWALAKAGPEWPASFRDGSAQAFAFRSDAGLASERFLIGALSPSRDQAGRLFPLSIAMPVLLGGDLLSAPELLPFAVESIWERASRCAVALSTGSGREPFARLLAEPAGESEPFTELQSAYAAWGEALAQAELWTLISGSPELTGLSQSLRFVAAAVEPLRQRQAPETHLSLRLPLGAAGGAAVCFWLDVVRRLVGWRSTVPSFFWSHDGSSGQLTLHLGVPPPATLSELWRPTRQRDEFCDLSRPLEPAVVQLLPPLPARVQQTLEESRSVAALLTSLSN